MKKEKTAINDAGENNEVTDISNIGQILNINSEDIKTMMRNKKIYLILGTVLFLVAILTGCIDPGGGGGGTHYMAICIKDFSWIWRYF